MRILTLLVLFALHNPSWAHEELEPRPIQDTVGSSFALPFYVSTEGEVSFLKNNFSDAFSFSPIINAGGSFRKAHYVLPERNKSFFLSGKDEQDRWLEVHRREISAGLGITALIKSTFKLGLVPFKGAKQKLVRISSSAELKTLSLSLLPARLKEVEQWSVGDQGTYESFGGIEIMASSGISIGDISGSWLLQNAFIIEITRISQDEVSIGLFEKNDDHRTIGGGIPLAKGALSSIKGKTFGSEFVLDLTIPEHHELYESALAGKVIELQSKLPYSSQKTSWNGTVKNFTLGIPLLAGKNWRSGRVEIVEKNTSNVLVFSSNKSKGMILPLRDIHRMLFFSPRQMVLFWSSELKKVNGALLEKRFLKIGRKIGVDGFDFEVDPKLKIGSAMTQLGVTFTQSELAAINESLKVDLDRNYEERCKAFELKCQQAKVRHKILTSFYRALKQPWLKGRELVGKLLVKNPALINSVVRTLKLNKKGYFYLLSDTVKSTEGMGEISP